MTLAELLPRLRERGVRVWVENGQLRYAAPKGALTPELRDALMLHKETLISVLTASPSGPTRPTRALRAARRGSSSPLSFAQQRLWLLERLNPKSAAYNIPSAIRLTGKLDVEALRRSFEEIVRRHEALRTAFRDADDDGEPRQWVQPPPTWELPIIEVGDEREVLRLATEEALRPFSLETGPLLRTTLLARGARSSGGEAPEEHVLLLTMHHIASDGWSDGVLVHELSALYRAYHEGRASPLSELELQYADFALWQRTPEQGRVLDQQTSYWREKLHAIAPLELPTDRPRPSIQTTRGAMARRKIVDAHPLAKLRRWATEHEATTFMVLLAAFHMLLARYSGQTDIAVGIPIANRAHQETEALIGFFVNTLVIRVRVDPFNPQDVLARTREAVLGAHAHQDVPFERLVAELQPERDRSRSPLFQVMFAHQSAPATRLDLPGLSVSAVDVPTSIAKFDLSLSVIEDHAERTLDCGIEYNTDLFDRDTIEAMLEHYEIVLRAMAEQSQTGKPQKIDLLTARERRHLLIECNDTQRPYDEHALLHQLFEREVEREPNAIALAFGEEQVTYADLNQRANRLAHHLRDEHGVAPDVLVGVCLDRSITMVVALLAILKAGGAYVPLDPEYPHERLRLVAERAGLSLIVTQSKRAALVEGTRPDARRLLVLDANETTIGTCADDNPPATAAPLAAAYVLFTSGSTGVPKGVVIAHRSVVLFLHGACRAVSRASLAGVLSATSIAFDMSVFELFAPLSFGGSVILARDALDLEALERPALPITLVHTVPSVMREWVHMSALPETVRLVALGGESLSRDLVTSLFSRFSFVTRVLNTYGPTEDTVWSIVEELARGGRGSESSNDSAIPTREDRPPAIGVSIDNRIAYVLDADLDPVPYGVVGELWVAGDGLARGYLDQPALTAERFVPDPFSVGPAGGRMYRTGDLARRRRDGVIECLGRVDFQVKLRGFRIELQEIEARLLEHPRVRDAVVVVAADEDASDPQLVAYFVGDGDDDDTPQVLREHLAARLPKHMVPSMFVQLEALPLTSNGKIDRRALPAVKGQGLTAPAAPPRDALELRLMMIWQDLLPARRIGARDNFFLLGGHSLLAVRLVARIRADLGCELPLAALFEHPTIEALARLLRQSPPETLRSSLVAIQPRGSRRPLFCVHPIGGGVLCFMDLARALGPEQPLFALQSIALTDSTTPPDDTVEKMARRYIDAIRGRQPRGPYDVLGYSIGGTIAYAIATALADEGEVIASLTLLDAPAPSTLAGSELETVIDANDAARALEVDAATARRLREIMAANFRAASSYRPRSKRVPITLIRPTPHGGEGVGEEDSLGWADVVGREMMTICRVGGDHISMLTEPHVANIAQLIVGSVSR